MADSDLFAHTTGPKDAKIMLVGEAFNEQDAKVKLPFQGRVGDLLRDLCKEAGLRFSDILLTNTFNFRPPDNDLKSVLTDKKSSAPGFPPVTGGKYLPPHLLPEVERLWKQIRVVKPNLTIAAGATAAWALLGVSGITGVRGYIAPGTYTPGKVLPTFHPAAVLRQWSSRPVVLADLMKAKREAEYPEIRRKNRLVLVNPTLAELSDWFEKAKHAPILACDIETAKRQISMVGFATSTSDAAVIPFHNPEAADWCYWPYEQELIVRALVQELLAGPAIKLFQNGLYDLQYFWREGFTVLNALEDTMLRQHAIYPEMQKGLGFLGSIHTNEQSWKLSRRRAADETVKKDE